MKDVEFKKISMVFDSNVENEKFISNSDEQNVFLVDRSHHSKKKMGFESPKSSIVLNEDKLLQRQIAQQVKCGDHPSTI